VNAQAYDTTKPIVPRGARSTSSTEFDPTGAATSQRIYGILDGMSSKYKAVSSDSTTYEAPNPHIDALWERIFSLAGVWEGDADDDFDGLFELRTQAWGNRLDGIDDFNNPPSSS
jgi:hypothetical protein